MSDTTVEPASVTADATRTLRTLVLIGFFAVVFAVALRPALDGDLWWHLRTAQWMVEHHDWVGVDPFTHTRPGVARVQTDWLAQLTFYGTWRAGGLMAVSLLMAGVATAGTYVVYRTTSGPLTLRLAVTGVAAAASSIHWVARPQMFSFLFTALTYALLRHWRRQGGPEIWWLVPLVLLWTNVHGGVIYGMLIVVAVTAGEWANALLLNRIPGAGKVARPVARPERLRLTLVLTVAVAVMSINPSGIRVYGLPFHQVSASVAYIDEFRPPSPGDVWVWPFFVLLVATAYVVARSWRHLDFAELLPLAGATLMALRFTRSIPFFAIVAAPIVAEGLRRSWPRTPAAFTEREASRLRSAVALVVVAVVITTPMRVWPTRVEASRQATFPVAATDWLQNHRPPGELFNTFNWGGYLMLHAPEYRVAVDSRTDVYDEYLDVYVATVSAEPGWEDELEREGVNTVLLNHSVPLTAALRDDPGWELVYEDDVAVVFSRA